MATVRNRKVVLKNYVSWPPKESDFEIINITVKLQLPNKDDSSAILVKNLYLSCDPSMIPPLQKLTHRPSKTLGTPLIGFGICEILESNHPNFNKGDLVSGITKWEKFSIITDSKIFFKIPYTDCPLSYFTGIFGFPGLCAYVGLYKICNPQKEDRVFISTASTIIGQLFGQFAKLMGCYVVACVDSQEKIDFLKNKLGFDNAFNEREEEDLTATLKRYFPQGIDICFDNVRGEILDVVLANMRHCGVIAVTSPFTIMDKSVPKCFNNFNRLKANNIIMVGFSMVHFYNLHRTYMEMILPLMKENKVIYEEDIVEGLENGPATLIGVCSPQNVQKKIIHVARE